HVRTTFEIIQRTNAVPTLDAGGRVAARLPPPAVFDDILAFKSVAAEMPVWGPIGAVVNAGNLAQLQRIDNEANVTVAREPNAVVLECRLVAVAALAGMTADVKDGRQLSIDFLGPIQVTCHIQARLALEVQFLDDHLASLCGAGGSGM